MNTKKNDAKPEVIYDRQTKAIMAAGAKLAADRKAAKAENDSNAIKPRTTLLEQELVAYRADNGIVSYIVTPHGNLRVLAVGDVKNAKDAGEEVFSEDILNVAGDLAVESVRKECRVLGGRAMKDLIPAGYGYPEYSPATVQQAHQNQKHAGKFKDSSAKTAARMRKLVGME
jgi:hypothetical protein